MASESEVVFGLRTLFERVLEEGYKLDDKCLRNELCILINYIATCSDSHKYFLDHDSENPDSHSFLDVI
jgi:hypothetical protein